MGIYINLLKMIIQLKIELKIIKSSAIYQKLWKKYNNNKTKKEDRTVEQVIWHFKRRCVMDSALLQTRHIQLEDAVFSELNYKLLFLFCSPSWL